MELGAEGTSPWSLVVKGFSRRVEAVDGLLVGLRIFFLTMQKRCSMLMDTPNTIT